MAEVGLSSSNQYIEIDYMELDKIIEEQFHNDKENLIMILQEIQRKYNYLPQASLVYLSEKSVFPLVRFLELGHSTAPLVLNQEANISFPCASEPPAT